MALITRGEKGSKLTIGEMDSNLLGLDTGKFQGDKFRQLLEDNNIFDEGVELSESDFYNGSEKVEGVLGANPTDIFDIIDEEDFEILKAPLVSEEPNYIIYSGTRLGQVENGFVIINGIIFPQGGDFSGPGTIILSNSLEEDGSYFEIVDLGLFAWKYAYSFDSEEDSHFHYIELRLPIFGIPFAVIEVNVDDAADSWEEVDISIEGLAPQS